MWKTLAPCLALIALALSPASAAANEHDGFFLRLSAGVGGGNINADSTPDVSITGGGGIGSFAIGGAVTENLVLHAEIFLLNLISPSVEVGGQDTGALDESVVRMGGLGFGITYYFMPINLYLSAAIGVASFSAEYRSNNISFESNSEAGLGLDFLVGKEWWVSENWGLGVAGQFIVVTVKEGAFEVDNTGLGFGVLFSSTYN